jgi:hypothetical protein
MSGWNPCSVHASQEIPCRECTLSGRCSFCGQKRSRNRASIKLPEVVTCGRSECTKARDKLIAEDRREGKVADKAMTRPQDWAPPARAHLFGLETLNDAEFEREMARRAAYPDRYQIRSRSRS